MSAARLTLALLLASAGARAEQRYAIVIGANPGWTNDRPLRHAEGDAERVRDVLVELGGFAADRVTVMQDPETADVRARLKKLAQTARDTADKTLVLFYYSGHADGKFLHLRGAPLSFDELYAQLKDLPATVRVGIFDACKSGSILAAKGGAPVAPFQVNVVDDLDVRGLAILTSSGADELSQERKALAGSVFTHHLVSGLRGAADLDRNGQVTLSEAYRYAFQRTQADTAGTLVPQRPAFRYEVKGQGELVMSWPSRAASALVLPRSEGDRYVVVDERELQLVAEGRGAPDRDVQLGLAPGRYRVKRVLADELEVAAVALKDGASVPVKDLAFQAAPLSAGLVKGTPDQRDPVEVRAYRRSEGLRLLAAGDPGTALGVFEEILKAAPEDRGSQRGKARALVRLAEAYDRVGDHAQEQASLQTAIVADPTLSEDPDFALWYRRMQELEAQTRRDAEVRAAAAAELEANPRLKKRWGLGFDFLSDRGLIAASVYGVVWGKVFPSLAYDIPIAALDLSVRFVPLSWKFSPYIEGGVHASFSQLFGIAPNGQGHVGDIDANELYGRNVHVDAGVQYVGSLGFSFAVGIGVVGYLHADGSVGITGFPSFSLAWYL